jgi:hypothetical protein
MTSVGSAETSRYREYARARLEEALFILDTGSDIEILAAAELALMALSMDCGPGGPITLNPEDVDEVMAQEAEPGPACIARRICSSEAGTAAGAQSTATSDQQWRRAAREWERTCLAWEPKRTTRTVTARATSPDMGSPATGTSSS